MGTMVESHHASGVVPNMRQALNRRTRASMSLGEINIQISFGSLSGPGAFLLYKAFIAVFTSASSIGLIMGSSLLESSVRIIEGV